MKTYALYLESGPKKQRTMVHVLELLGCVAKGSTTDEAIANTPAAIRAYLKFLKRHSAPVEPGEFKTKIVEHIMEGQWLGNGDPALVFQFDLIALTPIEIETYLQRLTWTRADIVKQGNVTDPEVRARIWAECFEQVVTGMDMEFTDGDNRSAD